MKKKILFCTFFIAFVHLESLFCQDTLETTTVVLDSGSTESSPLKYHSPQKAAIYSAILPGLGQAYNKKYWKIPIIYAALGATGYILGINQYHYSGYRCLYRYRTDSTFTDDACINKHLNSSNFNYDNMSDDDLKSERDEYRKFRDLDILVLIGIYALTIVDANVDAHLFYFDISDDLSLQLSPHVSYSSIYTPYIGINGMLKF